MADTPVKIILIEPGPITSRIRANSIPHFERWIDWEASPRAEQYRATLLRASTRRRARPVRAARLGGDAQLIRALDARTPARATA
jgi:hypothetical protein